MIRSLLLSLITIVATIVAGPALHAGEPEDDSTDVLSNSGRYRLKNRSSFSLSESTRAPFWPIGWQKGKTAAKVEAAAPRQMLDATSFRVTSILLGHPALAVINGRAYSEGEFLRTPRNVTAPRVRVQRIADGMVLLQHEDQVLKVALHRPQLEPKQIEEELLNEEQ